MFDVDGTLTNGFYIVKFSEFLFKGDLFPKNNLKEIENSLSKYKKGKNYAYEQFAWDLINAFGEGIKGRNKENISKLADKYMKENREDKFEFTDSLVKLVKQEGYTPIIISGSPAEIITPFAKSLGIKASFATTYEIENGIFTGKVLRNCALESEKKKAFHVYCKSHEVDLEKSAGFGDSHHDLAFLNEVGFPVAVNPNEKLKQIAIGKGWLVCEDNGKVLSQTKKYLP